MSTSKAFAFDGFASYATDPDASLVRLVEATIEGFHRRPGIARDLVKELKICVDWNDFVIGANRANSSSEETVEVTIRINLRRARCLIVFGGPSTRDHTWINKEIRWWAEDCPNAPIYFVLTHGNDPYAPGNRPIALDDRPDAIWFDLRGYYQLRSFDRTRAGLVLLGRTAYRQITVPFWRRRRRPNSTLGALSLSLPVGVNQNHLPVRASIWTKVRPFGDEVARSPACPRRDRTAATVVGASSLICGARAAREAACARASGSWIGLLSNSWNCSSHSE